MQRHRTSPFNNRAKFERRAEATRANSPAPPPILPLSTISRGPGASLSAILSNLAGISSVVRHRRYGQSRRGNARVRIYVRARVYIYIYIYIYIYNGGFEENRKVEIILWKLDAISDRLRRAIILE